MSQAERSKEDKRDAKKSGSQSSRRVSAQKDHTGADWSSVDPGLLRDVIAQVAKQGGALRFSYTRDGGAYCIGILGDGDPYNDYVKPSEDVEDYLQRLKIAWGG